MIQTDLLARGFQAVQPAGEVEAAPKTEAVEEVAIAGVSSLVAPAVSTATGAAKSVLDLLALFRTDVSYSGRSVVVKETPLMLEIAEQLRQTNSGGQKLKEINFLYPKLLLYRPGQELQDSTRRLESTK